jgi:hypothetical protein
MEKLVSEKSDVKLQIEFGLPVGFFRFSTEFFWAPFFFMR